MTHPRDDLRPFRGILLAFAVGTAVWVVVAFGVMPVVFGAMMRETR